MTRTERDRPAALAASEASQAQAKRDTALRDAAPELLEALKACAAVCAGETMNKRGLISALEQARAAMRKATGDTP